MDGGVLPMDPLRGEGSMMSVRKEGRGTDTVRGPPAEAPSPTSRERILRKVSESGGITFRRLARGTGLANGVTDYHLSGLLREGRLWKATYEGRPHFFAGRQPIAGIIALTKAERVAWTLPINRAVTVKEASAMLQMPPSTVRRCLAVLQAEGLLGETKEGRSKKYWIKDREALGRSIKAKVRSARDR